MNEIDRGHIVFVESVKPTIVSPKNCDAQSLKVIQTWLFGNESKSGTLVPLVINPSYRLNLSL